MQTGFPGGGVGGEHGRGIKATSGKGQRGKHRDVAFGRIMPGSTWCSRSHVPVQKPR